MSPDFLDMYICTSQLPTDQYFATPVPPNQTFCCFLRLLLNLCIDKRYKLQDVAHIQSNMKLYTWLNHVSASNNCFFFQISFTFHLLAGVERSSLLRHFDI